MSMSTEPHMLDIGGDRYAVRPWLGDELADLARWRQLDDYGAWRSLPATAPYPGIVGEWIEESPSLFFNQRIEGDYLWQVRATRLRTDDAFHRRFARHKDTAGVEPAGKYNFNFWLRVDSPDGEDFWQAYPRHLGQGWNGMGDDHWNALYNTVVWNLDDQWVRLRRSPGYVMVAESTDVVQHLPYDEPHLFTFALQPSAGRVRAYYDNQRIYEYTDPGLPQAGYIGLCVWLCKMRFDAMKLYGCLDA